MNKQINIVVKNEVPNFAKASGWAFEFDIPSDNPDDYYYVHNNTEVQQAWDEIIDLAVEYLNTLYAPDAKFIWDNDYTDFLVLHRFPSTTPKKRIKREIRGDSYAIY